MIIGMGKYVINCVTNRIAVSGVMGTASNSALYSCHPGHNPTILREKRRWVFGDDEPGVLEEKMFRITHGTRPNECPQSIDHPFPARRAAKEIHGDEDIARVLDRFDNRSVGSISVSSRRRISSSVN